MSESNKKDFFPNVTDPEMRKTMIEHFFATSGVPGAREDLQEVKEALRQDAHAPKPDVPAL